MPIYGLTDRSASFKELGRLRLGIPKEQAAQSGPKEIGYFRADFRPDAMDAAQAFTEAYGLAPDKLNIRLPFTDISRCWDAYYMAYNRTGLLGMADGIRWLYLRDNHSGALLVRDGIPNDIEKAKVDDSGALYMPFDKTAPVYSYKSSKGVDVPVFAKPEGRLRVLIPELKRAAFMTCITHSIYNCIRISEQLEGIRQVASNVGMTLPLVPMVLSRRMEQISVSINGRKAMQGHYLLNIEIDPFWMAKQFEYLGSLLPGVSLALPAPAIPEVDAEDLAESDTFTDPDPDPEQEPELYGSGETRTEQEAPVVDAPTPGALREWQDLVDDARRLGIPTPELPANITMTMLVAWYRELFDKVTKGGK